MTSLVDQLKEATADNDRQREIRYRDLIREIGNSDVPDPEAVQALDEYNKTPEEIAADVQHYQRRVELRKQLERLPGLLEERRIINGRLQDALERFNEARQQYINDTKQLREQLLEIDRDVPSCDGVKRQLYNSCRCPVIAAREAAITAESKELNRTKRQIQDRILHLRQTEIPSHEEVAAEQERRGFKKEAQETREYLTQTREKLADLEKRQSEKKQRLLELNRERELLAEQKLEP